jgi:ABC-type branched-subunit amino acid transport system ATPase component
LHRLSPAGGLAPTVLEQLFETFDRLRREIAIIIIDHNLGLALALSDRKVAICGATCFGRK